MADQFDRISDIDAEKETWKLKVRLIRLWDFPNSKNPSINNSMEMVLIDEAGGKIHATLGKRFFYKFQSLLIEGGTYTMANFSVEQNTVPEFNVSLHGFSFTPLHEIIEQGPEVPHLVDIIGLLSRVGTEREYDKDGKRTRMNVIEVTSNGIKIECTLFEDNYVNQFNTFLASGVTSAVVIIQFVKVKSFRGQVVLQNMMYATKLFFDADIKEAKDFKKSFSEGNENECSQRLSQLSDYSNHSIEDDFLRLIPRKTIDEIHLCKQNIVCVTLATIVHVDEGEKWWYTACNKCNKSVVPKSGMYHCDSCNIFVGSVSLRYRLKVVVDDESNCASFVIFDRDASFLFGKTCADMLDEVQKGGDLHELPAECKRLIDKLFLFKVDVKYPPSSKLEPSYRVIRLSDDPSLIQKFKETTSDNVVECTPSSGRHAEAIHLGTDEDSAIDKNLISQFTETVEESIRNFYSISNKRSNEIMESCAGDETKKKEKGLRQYAKMDKLSKKHPRENRKKVTKPKRSRLESNSEPKRSILESNSLGLETTKNITINRSCTRTPLSCIDNGLETTNNITINRSSTRTPLSCIDNVYQLRQTIDVSNTSSNSQTPNLAQVYHITRTPDKCDTSTNFSATPTEFFAAGLQDHFNNNLSIEAPSIHTPLSDVYRSSNPIRFGKHIMQVRPIGISTTGMILIDAAHSGDTKNIYTSTPTATYLVGLL
ncbi:hypothetical protein ACFE04_001847 [Oxalis oulophora]